MQLTISQSRGYDILKFLAAMVILSSHCDWLTDYPISNVMELVNGIFIPIFFAISSFFFTNKLMSIEPGLNGVSQKGILVSRVKRLLILYAVWYLISFPWTYYRWFEVATLKETIFAFMLDSTAWGYWFIKALIINTVIVYLAVRHRRFRVVCLYLSAVWFFLAAYNYIYKWYPLPFSPYYTFTYHVFPCMIGLYAARKGSFNMLKLSLPVNVLLLLLLLASILFFHTEPIYRISSILLLCSVVEQIKWPDNLPYVFIRKTSILIYMLQFDTILSYRYFQKLYPWLDNGLLRTFICAVVVILISMAIIRLSERPSLKKLKYLY